MAQPFKVWTPGVLGPVYLGAIVHAVYTVINAEGISAPGFIKRYRWLLGRVYCGTIMLVVLAVGYVRTKLGPVF